MKISVKFSQFALIQFIFILIVAITSASGEILGYTVWMRMMGLIALLNVYSFFLYIRISKKNMFSLATVFVIFLYLFNLGLHISYLFNWINYDGDLFLQQRIEPLGESTMRGYTLFVYILISNLEMGIIYEAFKSHKIRKIEEKKELYTYDELGTLKFCRKLGIALLLVSLVPFIIVESATIRSGLMHTYQSIGSTVDYSGNPIDLLASLYKPAIIIWMYGLQKKESQFNVLFLITTCYLIIRMFITGDRSESVIFILVLVLLRHLQVKPIEGKQVFFSGLTMYIGMLAIKLAEIMRSISNADISLIVKELFNKNMISTTIYDYGGNVWSALMVFKSVPDTGSFRFGLTYIAALFGKPLQVLGITDAVINFSDYSVFLKASERGSVINHLTKAMGGSFAGEWYFNFGFLGVLLIFFFGRALSNISDYMISNKKKSVLSAFVYYEATLLIWWVRQYFPSVTWYTLVYGFMVIIMAFILNRGKWKYLK